MSKAELQDDIASIQNAIDTFYAHAESYINTLRVADYEYEGAPLRQYMSRLIRTKIDLDQLNRRLDA